MTARTWTGAQNSSARDPNNWTPTGIPQPGDTLTMTDGTMDIRDQDLAGNTLLIDQQGVSTAAATLNLSGHAKVSLDMTTTGDRVTVNVKGSDTLNARNESGTGGQGLTVNLAQHATLLIRPG